MGITRRTLRHVVSEMGGVVLGLAVVTALLVAGCTRSASRAVSTGTAGQKGTPLRVGLIPNIAPEEQRAKYAPFEAYLEKKLGVPVELFVATNYAGVVQAFVSDKLDMAYFGGLTYAQAEQQTAVEPIVTEIDRETGTTEYYSLIIARKGGPVGKLADLAGKSFAFGDPSSTSGSLYPRIMLAEAGFKNDPAKLDEMPPLAKVLFSGGHDATAEAVVSGKVDAGGIEGRVLARLEKEGKVDASQVIVLGKTLVQGYPWCVRASMDPVLRDRIVDAFLAIDDPALLDLMRAKRYVRTSVTDYDEIRQQAAALGLLSTK